MMLLHMFFNFMLPHIRFACANFTYCSQLLSLGAVCWVIIHLFTAYFVLMQRKGTWNSIRCLGELVNCYVLFSMPAGYLK